MAEATDAQMQAFCDQRIRQRAEALRLLLDQCNDDKSAIGDEYARATGTNAWADARTDGPPHLLQSGNSANPDDLLNYNALISSFIAWVATNQSSWNVLMNACVRPIQGY